MTRPDLSSCKDDCIRICMYLYVSVCICNMPDWRIFVIPQEDCVYCVTQPTDAYVTWLVHSSLQPNAAVWHRQSRQGGFSPSWCRPACYDGWRCVCIWQLIPTLSVYVCTATHCNTLQHMATHCNTLQLTTHTYSICLCIYLYIHCVYSFVPRARMADGVFACVTGVLHFSVHLCIYTLYSLRCRASGWLAACVYVT